MSRRSSDEGEGGAEDGSHSPPAAAAAAGGASRRQRRGVTAEEATAAAAAHRDRMVAAMERERPKRAWKDLLPSEQVVQLEPDELWPTIAAQWGRPGAELITSFAEAWEGEELAAVVLHLGLEVPPRRGRRDYWETALRRQVVAAVRAYAADHPELFADAQERQEREPQQPEARQRSDRALLDAARESPPGTPPQAGNAAALRDRPPESPSIARRSPRGSAASRSADAMRALGQLPLVDRALERAERPSPERKESKPPVSRARSSKRRVAALPRVDLLRHAAEDDDDPEDSPSSSSSEGESDADDRDWAQDSDDAAAAISARGGRLRPDEFDSRLAETGVHRRSFAKGFLRNALAAAAGRAFHQLFKELTTQWDASVHCKREALSHARTLDLLLVLPRNVRGVSEVLEHVCRRLGGVQTAALSGSWEMCDRLESETSVKNFVPDYFMSTALKQVTREQAVRKSAAEGLNAGKRPSSQGAGRKPRGGHSSGSSGRSNGAHGPGGPTSGADFPPTSTQVGGGRAGSRKK